MERLTVDRNAIRPATTWNVLLPVQTRRSSWSSLHEAVGVKPWPQLTRPRTVEIVIFTVALFVGTVVTWFVFPNPSAGVAGVLSVVLAAAVLLYATASLRVEFPNGLATVGATAEFLATYAPGELKGPEAGWTREQIRAVVHGLIRDMFNVGEFSDDSRFVEDMGLD